jgi:hypothetical protein
MTGEDVAVNLTLGECLGRSPGLARPSTAIDPRKVGTVVRRDENILEKVWLVPSRTGRVTVDYATSGCHVIADDVDPGVVARRVDAVLSRPTYAAKREISTIDGLEDETSYQARYRLDGLRSRFSVPSVEVGYQAQPPKRSVHLTVDNQVDGFAIMEAQGLKPFPAWPHPSSDAN